MNILVTGGAGFIGSHTCVELLSAGHDLVVIDNFCNSKPEMLDKIRKIAKRSFVFVQGDVRDGDTLSRLFRENSVDAVIHFAGLKAVGESVEKPLAYYENNLGSTIELLKQMRAHAVKRLVFSSSATVYGINNPAPFREEYPTSAINPYGMTKVMLEQILMDVAHAEPDFCVCLLRYFNPIGAHPSGLIGEDPSDIPNNLFPYVAQVAAGKLRRVKVYGNDYPTPDGTGVRDYVHVVDIAQGHLAALNYVTEHTGVEAVNLGTGGGTSVLELIHAFEKACGHSIPYEFYPRRAGDIGSCYAATEKAMRLFGWSAKYDLDDMCRDGWAFAKSRYESTD